MEQTAEAFERHAGSTTGEIRYIDVYHCAPSPGSITPPFSVPPVVQVTLDEALVYPRIVCGAETRRAEGDVTEGRVQLFAFDVAANSSGCRHQRKRYS
jgi:hypothetical protein